MDFHNLKFSTRAIHVGQTPDPSTGAVTPPIYMSSTFVQEAPGRHKGYEYSRTKNPTRSALEENVAALENGTYGLAFSSGCAATHAVISLLKPGDHVISSGNIYGGTVRLFETVFRPWGISFSYAASPHMDHWRAALQKNTRMIWLETPTNPLLQVTSIADVVALAKPQGIRVTVDNTFATPYIQKPLEHGADLVAHSATKYLGGHSDLIGGVVVTRDKTLYERCAAFQNSVGAILGPMDAFLMQRGIKTLALRMERHSANARQVASFLLNHPKVERVYFPEFVADPVQKEAVQRQMALPGGMVSFEIKGSLAEAKRFASLTKIFLLAESLGGVESLIDHPATMTDASLSSADRARVGIRDTLIRLSVGIEDGADLIEDLRQAFTQL